MQVSKTICKFESCVLACLGKIELFTAPSDRSTAFWLVLERKTAKTKVGVSWHELFVVLAKNPSRTVYDASRRPRHSQDTLRHAKTRQDTLRHVWGNRTPSYGEKQPMALHTYTASFCAVLRYIYIRGPAVPSLGVRCPYGRHAGELLARSGPHRASHARALRPGCCRCGSCAVCAVEAADQVAERTSCSCGECYFRPWAQRAPCVPTDRVVCRRRQPKNS